MEKIKFRLVYNRKKRLNNMRQALIQVEAYCNKEKVYFSTHIYIHPEQWDKHNGRIIRHPQQEDLNRMTDEFILKLQWIELKAWKLGKQMSLALLKECFINDIDTSQNLFIPWSRKWVENSMRKKSTQQNLFTTLDLLEDLKKKLTFGDLTYTFILNFESYLLKNNLSVNTVAKHMSQFRTLVNEAIKQGYLSNEYNPFSKYKIKTIPSKHTFLLPNEIYKLENLDLSFTSNTLRHSLDAFLFCCYTGLRYSDFIQLTSNNIIRLNQKNCWLSFQSVKTHVETRIPLYLLFQGKALDILRKYKQNLDSFFKLKSNSNVNKDLIKIGRLANIDKHFSFHSARHTNATLLIYNGAQITTVQKLLGHRSIKTTQGYSDIFSGTIIKDLKKCKF